MLADHRRGGDELWRAAGDQGFSPSQIDGLQLQGKLAYLTVNNAELAGPLQDEIGAPDAVARLVEHGLHRGGLEGPPRRDLVPDEAALQRAVPPAYAGATTADRLDAYAERPRPQGAPELSHAAWSATWSRRTSCGSAATMAELKRRSAFLKKRRAGLRAGPDAGGGLRAGPRAELFRRHAAEAIADDARRGQAPAARLPDHARRDEALDVAARAGLRLGPRRRSRSRQDVFVERFGATFGATRRKLVYRKAQQVRAVAYNFFTRRKQLGELGGRCTRLCAGQPDAAQRPQTSLIRHYPTLESLFGSLDFCECEHCRSVLSPAAYLVDLLQFLDPETQAWDDFLSALEERRTTSESYASTSYCKTPFDALVERRPDLPHLPLTCENTNTALPYIDVVNEILEYYVANGNARRGGGATTPASATTRRAARRAAERDARRPTRRCEQARYPLALPFDLWLETVRRFFEHFETPLWQVLESFRPSDDLFAPRRALRRVRPRGDLRRVARALAGASTRSLTDPDPLQRGTSSTAIERTARPTPRREPRPELGQGALAAARRQLQGAGRRSSRPAFVNPQLDALVVLRKLGVEVGGRVPLQGPRRLRAVHRASGGVRGAARRRSPQLNPSGDSRLRRARWLDDAWQAGRLRRASSSWPARTRAATSTRRTLRYADGDAADALVVPRAQPLRAPVAQLGWTIEETDRALQAFLPATRGR